MTKLISPLDINLLDYAERIGIPKVVVKSILDRKGSLDEERYLSSLYIFLSLISRGRI